MKNNSRSSLLTILQIIFFVILFSFPRILQELKIGILGIITVAGLLAGTMVKINLKNLLYYFLIFAISFILGGLRSNDITEIINGTRVYLIFPMIILVLLCTIKDPALEYVLKKASFFSIIIICLIALSSLLNALGYFPVNLNSYLYEDEKNVGVYEGYIHIINTSLTSLVFVVPFYYHDLRGKISLKNPDLYVLIFAFVISVVSSRRILLLPFIFIYLINIRRLKFVSVLMGILFFYLLVKGFISQAAITAFTERMSDAVNDKGDSAVRELQKVMFVKYIERSPFIGYGLGAYMPDLLRNDQFKSAYEASYHYLVFVFGIPLTLVFIAYYIKIFYDTYINKFFTLSYRKGLIIAGLCFLAASYTNPYWMSSFDFIVPFALLLRSAK